MLEIQLAHTLHASPLYNRFFLTLGRVFATKRPKPSLSVRTHASLRPSLQASTSLAFFTVKYCISVCVRQVQFFPILSTIVPSSFSLPLVRSLGFAITFVGLFVAYRLWCAQQERLRSAGMIPGNG